MSKVLVVGGELDAYIKRLEDLYERSDDMIEKAIYPGAGIVADEVRKAIQSLPKLDREPRITKSTKDTRKANTSHKTPGKVPRGVTDVEKKGLLDSMGLARIRDDSGFINTKLGFDGYNDHKTPSYPQGHPNVMIARSVEVGTSFRAKSPFIEPTVRAVKDRAERKMKAEYDKEVKKIMH